MANFTCQEGHVCFKFTLFIDEAGMKYVLHRQIGERIYLRCILRQISNGTAWIMEGSLVQGKPLTHDPDVYPDNTEIKSLFRVQIVTNVTGSLYHCDGLIVPMWWAKFSCSSGIYFFTDVMLFVSTIVTGEKYHYDRIIFPVPKWLFTNVQGCQCTNVPRPPSLHIPPFPTQSLELKKGF